MPIPTYAQLSVFFNQLVTERDGEWAGMPMPLPGCGLVLEDKHPGKARLAELQAIIDEPEDRAEREKAAAETDADREATRARNEDGDLMGWHEVNRWRGRTLHGVTGQIVILRHQDGRTSWGLEPDLPIKNKMQLGRFETLDAWNLETELNAIDRLASLLTARMYKAYILTGGFLETSKRSGIHYWFRRLLPTVAIARVGSGFRRHGAHDDGLTALCALCLHPLGYYRNTFCGAMTPTDDVIAHLLMMRADEHCYWKRANQHPAIAPESGL